MIIMKTFLIFESHFFFISCDHLTYVERFVTVFVRLVHYYRYEAIDMKDTTKVVTATEFKTNLGKYLDYAAEDNDIVITKNGNKFARLTPYISQIERYFTVKERAMDYQYGGKKVSYEEFMEIYENSELRMEYINGEIVLLASPSTFHQDISGNLYVFLRSYLKGKKCKVFYAPFD